MLQVSAAKASKSGGNAATALRRATALEGRKRSRRNVPVQEGGDDARDGTAALSCEVLVIRVVEAMKTFKPNE